VVHEKLKDGIRQKHEIRPNKEVLNGEQFVRPLQS
jgi:hypothetical protein